MVIQTRSVLVIGFNIRPLAYSLKNAGYEVYAVDFFGDMDLYPNVKDCLIVKKEFKTSYNSIKEPYSKLFPDLTIKMLINHPNVDFLIIGSGLDDAYEEREEIIQYLKSKRKKILNLNNDIQTIKKARDIEFIYEFLKSNRISVPFTVPYENLDSNKTNFNFPCVLKKVKSAGGINVFKIDNPEAFTAIVETLELKDFNPSEWVIQEFIRGIPVSCTTISNGKECELISINQQIIGNQILNPPKQFMYCGNIVPAKLPSKDKKLISKLSKMLSIELGLKGINGFDFVLKDHYPYLMEINPRIPGSIGASELSLDLNLLDLHIRSFLPNEWKNVKISIKTKKINGYSTKLIFFSPKQINPQLISKINQIQFIHDKSEPIKDLQKGEPVCTILVKAKRKLESYKKGLEIVNKINETIGL
ncbi:MAG: ATP-grasp domain-containing protein [Promethearchaeota archaeon]